MTTAADQKRVQRNQGNVQPKEGDRQTRSQMNSKHGSATIQQTLDDARQALRKNAKAYVAAGISDALSDIANGDFGEIGNEIFDSLRQFTESLEMDALTLEAREVTEIPLLSSCTEED